MNKKTFSRLFSYPSTPVILLVICILSYGILSPFIGFFMDDWYVIWFKHTFGSLDLIQFFSLDRPLEGYYYVVVNFLLGNSENPLVWQIFGVFVRWLSVVALWQMLNTLWPQAKRQNTQVALIAAVFPGFTQQWIAASFSFHFVCLAGFFFSISLMLKAVRNPKRRWLKSLLSIGIMAYVIPASEFYLGLELIRWLILFFEFRSEPVSNRLRRAFLYWLPYCAILIVFILWRSFFYTSVNHSMAIQGIFAGGIGNAALGLVRKIYQSIVDSLMNAWVNPFNLKNYPSKGLMAGLIPGLMIGIFAALLIWLRKTDRTEDQDENEAGMSTWRREAPWVAIASLVMAILPFWAAGLSIDYLYPFDRFLLAYLFGSCLMVVWLLEGTRLNSLKTAVIISLLTSVALGYQLTIANQYKNMTSIQKDFYWQFYWRVPDLQKGSTVMAYQLPYDEYWSGNSLTSFLNWTYGDDVVDRKIDYQFILLNSGQEEAVDRLQSDQPITVDFRTYQFSGNTSDSLFVYYSTGSCVRVLDMDLNSPAYVVDTVAEDQSGDERVIQTISGARLSNLDLIAEGADSKKYPPAVALGKEVNHDWCYYFEKSELSHQAADYQHVVDLYTEASNLGYHALNETEYYPIIDSLGRTGDWDQARELTLSLLPIKRLALENGLCHLWGDLQSDFPENDIPDQVISGLKCQPLE